MAPEASWSRMAPMAGERRNTNPMPVSRPEALAAATMASASSTVGAIGFSQSTCLPAASRPSTIWRCSGLATTTLTTSTSWAAATASQPASARSNPKRRAVSVAKAGLTSAIAASRISGRPSS